MKKITVIFLLILAISLIGCGSSSSNKILGLIDSNFAHKFSYAP